MVSISLSSTSTRLSPSSPLSPPLTISRFEEEDCEKSSVSKEEKVLFVDDEKIPDDVADILELLDTSGASSSPILLPGVAQEVIPLYWL